MTRYVYEAYSFAFAFAVTIPAIVAARNTVVAAAVVFVVHNL